MFGGIGSHGKDRHTACVCDARDAGSGPNLQPIEVRTPSAVQLDSALMVPDLRSQDRMGCIKELVDRMHRARCVTDSLSFLQSVLDREDLESTVVGPGVAFPHARCRLATRLGTAFGISRCGIDFRSESHPHRVHLVCLLAVPTAGDGAYLPLLSVLTRFFQDLESRSGLMACHTPEEMYRFLSTSVLGARPDRTTYPSS